MVRASTLIREAAEMPVSVTNIRSLLQKGDNPHRNTAEIWQNLAENEESMREKALEENISLEEAEIRMLQRGGRAHTLAQAEVEQAAITMLEAIQNRVSVYVRENYDNIRETPEAVIDFELNGIEPTEQNIVETLCHNVSWKSCFLFIRERHEIREILASLQSDLRVAAVELIADLASISVLAQAFERHDIGVEEIGISKERKRRRFQYMQRLVKQMIRIFLRRAEVEEA